MNSALTPYGSAFGALRTEPPPATSEVDAERLVATAYGIVGRASVMHSERDNNFRIRTSSGSNYVLKVSHPAEDPDIVAFQTSALLHVADVDPGLAVPKVIPTSLGAASFTTPLADSRTRIVRLFTYLDGTILCDLAQSPAQDIGLGQFLARLGLALSSFYHDCAGDPGLLWDFRQIPQTAALTSRIGDPARRQLVDSAYDVFQSDIAPMFATLRSQVIHNDLNPDNTLVSPADPANIVGILDFGDIVHAPLVCDVAIGATYRWPPHEHPLRGIARFLKGYNSVCPLEDSEIALVPGLVRARLAIAVTMADWQANLYPDNRDYAMRFNAELWSSLQELSRLSRNEEKRVLREVLED